MYKLVLVRHGESLWNQENRFTGWQDIDLSEKGRAEAQFAGQTLKEYCRKNNIEFDLCYTSMLKRAIRTLWISLDEMDRLWLPVKRDWRLNERHYGALTGLDKAETAAKHGEEQVKIWRRSFDTPPPLLAIDDMKNPSRDIRYKNVPEKDLPMGESLKDTMARFLPLWKEQIAPEILAGKKILIAAHGNSLRALKMHVEKLSPAEIMEFNFPTGVPMLYNFDKDLNVIDSQFLGDPEEIRLAQEKVANQGKAK